MERTMSTRFTKMILPLTFCMALAVGVQAKAGQDTSKDSSKGKKMTVTGCLQTGSSPNTFVLNNVGDSTQSSKNQPSQSQTPGEMARSEGSSYMLIPSGNVNLQNWVGQRVQITGKMVADSSMSTSSGDHSQSGHDMSDSSSMSGTSELMVTTIKKVPGTCQ